MTRSILVAASEPNVGSCLASSVRELGWAVAGPFRSNADALDWLDVEQVDGAILDILLEDGSAFQLAATLHHVGIPLVFFEGFDAERKMIRAEFPHTSEGCSEVHLLELLTALEGTYSG